jgi:hypothetical protein
MVLIQDRDRDRYGVRGVDRSGTPVIGCEGYAPEEQFKVVAQSEEGGVWVSGSMHLFMLWLGIRMFDLDYGVRQLISSVGT